MPSHVFDQAIALTRQGADQFQGHTSPGYWNMVGPFGGISAALVMNAVMQHPARLGEPISLTINYASGMVQGVFSVTARAARTNRSTQHWVVEVSQPDAEGEAQTVLSASIISAVRRETWSGHDMPMPAVPAPHDVPRQTIETRLEWLKQYELRVVTGKMPRPFDGSVRQEDPYTNSLTQMWMRDEPPRPLDFCSLAAFADIFYPRVYLRRASVVNVGTVTMTVYFHVGSGELQDAGTGHVFGQARGQAYQNGYFDQSAQLWSESGTLLVTSLQLVYYRN